jgi:hypothetical protein
MLRYLLGLLAIIGLIVILIILLVPGKKGAIPGDGLIGYANTNTVMRLTIDGPENYQQNHQSVQITVGKDNVTYEQLVGYNGQVVTEQTFPNTVAAYDVFLRGLYYADYYNGDTTKSLSNENGVCALGTRYVYEINNGSSDVERFWSTNCGTKTYNGNISQTISLFQAQVPNFSNITANLDL